MLDFLLFSIYNVNMESKRKDKIMKTMVRIYNSSEKLVFKGSLEDLKNFPRNDSDRVVIG